jgi:hypothetical protein
MSSDRDAVRPFRCRIGLHHYADFPDPNPETRGLEQRGYRACTRCPREKDLGIYLPRRAQRWWPNRRGPG